MSFCCINNCFDTRIYVQKLHLCALGIKRMFWWIYFMVLCKQRHQLVLQNNINQYYCVNNHKTWQSFLYIKNLILSWFHNVLFASWQKVSLNTWPKRSLILAHLSSSIDYKLEPYQSLLALIVMKYTMSSWCFTF